MLFGVKLANEMYPPWRESYMAYDDLKALLKENASSKSDSWTDKEESRFVEALDKELEKVYTFQIQKYNTLLDKLDGLEKQTGSEEKIKTLDPESFQRILEDALTEAQELDSFARLNFTGFIKIVKKHDKLHPKYPSVKSLLEVRLKELPFHSEEYSPLLYRISYLYNILRGNFSTVSQSLASTSKLSNVGNSVEQASAEYKVYKFWIHKDNLMEVKTRILRHLPVLIYASTPSANDDLIDKFESEILDNDGGIQSSNSSPAASERKLTHNSLDPVITTLYFDNEFFELYNNKLLKNSHAPTLRLRWTGKLADKPDLFMEKKMMAEGTTPDEPNHFDECRIKMKQKYLNGFIFDGDKKYEESVIKRMTEAGSPESTISKTKDDFEEIQKFIMEEQVQPVMRTMYTRTAFQIPGDDRIRVTIDSDILYIREDAFDKSRPIRDPKSWHRTDIDADVTNPMRFLRSGEYAKFPYSVMEIKIKEVNSENTPLSTNTISVDKMPRKHGQWMSELTSSHLVKEIPKFSTFIQGIATLFGEEDKLDILPFWLPELENDIRINPKQAYEEEEDKLKKQKEIQKRLDGMRRLSKIQKQPPSLTGFDSELSEPTTASNGPGIAGGSSAATPTAYEADLEDHESSEDEAEGSTVALRKGVRRSVKQKKKQTTEAIFLNILAGRESKLTGFDSEEEEVELPAGVRKPTSYIKNAGPVKVEAKVWLANERTFNRWLKVTTLLSVLTFSIYNSVKKASFPHLANTIAYIYFGLTIFSGLWSYKTYIDRLKVIKERSGKHLDAPLGPMIVATVLAITLVVNFVVAFREAATRQRQAFTTAGSSAAIPELSENLQSIQNFVFWIVGAK